MVKGTLDIAGDIAKIQDQMSHGELIEFLTQAFNHAEIDGNVVLQTKEGEFLDYVLMEEQYFVDNWLTQFAIGFVGGKSYFDHESWYKLTIGFTKGVIVVDQSKSPVLIIRKFLEAVIPEEGIAVLERCAAAAGVAKVVADNAEKTKIINQLAEQIKYISEVADKHVSNSITDLIPDSYYQKHDIHPLTLQQVIYIRDRYKYKGEQITPENPVLGRVEKILKDWNLHGIATAPDQAFIKELTNGEFFFDNGKDMVEPKVPLLDDKGTDEMNDPFSC